MEVLAIRLALLAGHAERERHWAHPWGGQLGHLSLELGVAKHQCVQSLHLFAAADGSDEVVDGNRDDENRQQ